MATPAFFTVALSTALEQGLATAEDVLAFATPEVLSTHVPRPLWARLLTASLGTPGLTAADVVDTLGVANIATHVPGPILWACVQTIGQRALDGAEPTAPRAAARSVRAAVPPPPAAPAVAAPAPVAPPPEPVVAPPPIMPPSPAAAARAQADVEVDSALESLELGDDAPAYRPPPAPPGQASRALAGASSRRPQRRSVAPEPGPAAPEPDASRASSRDLDVLDEQLVEWNANEETKGGPIPGR